MPRGARKSPKEKLQQKLDEVMAAIDQYRKATETLEEQKKGLEEELAQLELKEVLELMKEKNLSTEEIKDIIEDYQPQMEQGA